jgi:hypothetical protein
MFSIFYCHLTHTQGPLESVPGPVFPGKNGELFFHSPHRERYATQLLFSFFRYSAEIHQNSIFLFFPVSEGRSHSHRTLINDVFKSILGKCSTGVKFYAFQFFCEETTAKVLNNSFDSYREKENHGRGSQCPR